MAGYGDFTWTAPADLIKHAQCQSTWGHYMRTKVHFDAGDRSGTVLPAGKAWLDTPPLGTLHVINAVQPGTDPCSDDNHARMAVLDHELQISGLAAIPALGSSLDGRYAEQSRAVFGLSDDAARALGRRFGQVAVFAWSGPTWSLLACATERKTHQAWAWVGDGTRWAAPGIR